MATMSLLDAFGLDASGSLRPNARLAEALPQFLNLKSTPLNQLQLSDGKANLTFNQPVALAAPGLSLAFGGSAGAHIRILKFDDHLLNREDPFNSVTIKEGEVYIELGIEFSATAGVSVSSNSLAFGLSADRGFTVTAYRRFFPSDAGAFPAFGAALAQSLQSFVIPQTQTDLDHLDRDTVIVISGTGQLQVTASFGIQTPVRQIAATSPVAGKMVEVNASGSFDAECSVTLEGGYQTRLRRLETQAIEIGIYKFQSRTWAVTVSAEAGVAAKIGKFDLAQKFIGALSHQPVLDLQEFQQALPGEDVVARDLQIAAFQRNLAAAVSTRIAASVTAGLSDLQSDEAALTFEVDAASKPSSSAVSAIAAAFKGDFSAFTVGASALPPGIRQTSNIFTRTDLAKHKLNVNLLGILNFVAISKLARVSSIERNANGEITLVSDTADANRLQALLLNASGNAQRLRSMLSEDFLFQATFKAVDLQVLPPDFVAKHTFLEINQNTSRQKMKDLLDVCRAVGVLSGGDESSRLQGSGDFGQTTFWLQTNYSSASVERTLLTPEGAARSQEEFEAQGRVALSRLLAGDQGQEFRKLIADPGPKGTGIWQQMKALGNATQFNRLFGLPLDAADPRVAAAAADFVCITSWAAAMNRLAIAVIEVRGLLKGSVGANDAQLTASRAHLQDRMADVVKHSGEQFGDPLGLVMVFLASGPSAGVSLRLAGPSVQPLTLSVAPGGLLSGASA